MKGREAREVVRCLPWALLAIAATEIRRQPITTTVAIGREVISYSSVYFSYFDFRRVFHLWESVSGEGRGGWRNKMGLVAGATLCCITPWSSLLNFFVLIGCGQIPVSQEFLRGSVVLLLM